MLELQVVAKKRQPHAANRYGRKRHPVPTQMGDLEQFWGQIYPIPLSLP